VEPSRIAELVNPYMVGLDLPPAIYGRLNAYLDLLLRWNARTNLTAIRDPEAIVTRHFGESLFAAKVLLEHVLQVPAALGVWRQPAAGLHGMSDATLTDLGSGAGFPGLPIKLAIPDLRVTLIESQNKKATFLKEVIRALKLGGIEVYSGRGETWEKTADVVTMRAVEKFGDTVAVARKLLAPGGSLCLLTTLAGSSKIRNLPEFVSPVQLPLPGSTDSVVWVGKLAAGGVK
jgi:16S rRNA (guanine527-N7)-methyltransferase